MKVLMGGSGSTGSSLLRTILNRHEEVFSGNELNFFNKIDFFDDWQKSKRKIFKAFPRISTDGWVPYPGTNLTSESYGWEKNEIRKIIQNSESLKEFIDVFFSRLIENNNARFWIEKTPSNSYCFQNFLHTFPDSKVIHTTRNPLDSVSSLVDRGFSPFFASGIWVYNTALALNNEKNINFFQIKYDDLVKNPENVVNELTDFLEISYDNDLLSPVNTSGKKIDSWLNSLYKPISNRSVGRFYKMNKSMRNRIITALSLFKISRKHIDKYNLKYSSCKDICEKINYNFPEKVEQRYNGRIRLNMMKDFVMRFIRRYRTKGFSYPAEIVM